VAKRLDRKAIPLDVRGPIASCLSVSRLLIEEIPTVVKMKSHCHFLSTVWGSLPLSNGLGRAKPALLERERTVVGETGIQSPLESSVSTPTGLFSGRRWIAAHKMTHQKATKIIAFFSW